MDRIKFELRTINPCHLPTARGVTSKHEYFRGHSAPISDYFQILDAKRKATYSKKK